MLFDRPAKFITLNVLILLQFKYQIIATTPGSKQFIKK
jgi:hypothetical protein